MKALRVALLEEIQRLPRLTGHLTSQTRRHATAGWRRQPDRAWRARRWGRLGPVGEGRRVSGGGARALTLQISPVRHKISICAPKLAKLEALGAFCGLQEIHKQKHTRNALCF